MKDTEQLIADLLEAAEVIRRQGWTKGIDHAADGKVCAEGALNVATGYAEYRYGMWLRPLGPFGTSERMRRALHALTDRAPHRLTVAGYNDRPATTKEDIILLFEQTAADLKREIE